ncbi:MAG TPA: hypothetical protein VGS27_26045 [Candidatus Sulfotelmatobacter sp.]|nr:hypothetical protein [Candidatus Sulfotelmatobacter sp.]
MGCPRCGGARVEHYGVMMRCAVCGMPTGPEEGISTLSQQQAAAPSELLASQEQAVLHS